jgi:hypothetical protein
MDRRTIESEIAELDRLIGEAERLAAEARHGDWHRAGTGLHIVPLARLVSAIESLFEEFRTRRDFLEGIKQLYR